MYRPNLALQILLASLAGSLIGAHLTERSAKNAAVRFQIAGSTQASARPPATPPTLPDAARAAAAAAPTAGPPQFPFDEFLPDEAAMRMAAAAGEFDYRPKRPATVSYSPEDHSALSHDAPLGIGYDVRNAAVRLTQAAGPPKGHVRIIRPNVQEQGRAAPDPTAADSASGFYTASASQTANAGRPGRAATSMPMLETSAAGRRGLNDDCFPDLPSAGMPRLENSSAEQIELEETCCCGSCCCVDRPQFFFLGW